MAGRRPILWKTLSTHNSRTNRDKIVKLGEEVDHVTRHVGQMTKVKVAKVRVKVTISRNVTNVSAAITLKSAKTSQTSPKFVHYTSDCVCSHYACAVSRDPSIRNDRNQLHNRNLRPHIVIAYSLYNLYGATMKIKGRINASPKSTPPPQKKLTVLGEKIWILNIDACEVTHAQKRNSLFDNYG